MDAESLDFADARRLGDADLVAAAVHADRDHHREPDALGIRDLAKRHMVNGDRQGRQDWPRWTNALIQYGDEARRDQVARELHAAGPAPSGPFVRLDCEGSEHTVRSVFTCWLLEDGLDPEPALLPITNGGTLFLDHVEKLSPECQQLLGLFTERLAEATAAGLQRPVGRLIAGTPSDLSERVRSGAFLPALHDALDKARIDLPRRGQVHTDLDELLEGRCRRPFARR